MSSPSTPFQKTEQDRIETDKRWQGIKARAAAQGLVEVQMSARRYIVIQIDSSSGGVSGGPGDSRHTWQVGRVVFGPANYADTRNWLIQNTPDIPKSECP
jgi:hypothetical protein